ncbi:MAG: MFS transporter [Candidatus Nanopelagicales bacterium]
MSSPPPPMPFAAGGAGGPDPVAQPLHLTRRTHVSYAFGSVGTGVFATVPGLVLAYYLTNTLGVAAGVAAFVVAVPKAWDVIVLPIVGRFSDRAAARVGSRLPFLKLAGILLPLSFILIFSVPPAFGPWAAAAWVFLTFIVASTAFALFQVPYIALSAELTDDAAERSTLMAWRVAFLTVAILLGGALAPLIRDALGGAYLGHFVMGLFMAGLMLAGIWLCVIGLSKAPARVAPAAEGSLVDQLRVVRHDAGFVALLVGFVIQALGFAAMLGAAQYYATYIVERPTAITILFVCLVAPAIVVMPFWNWVAHRYGKTRGFLAASGVFLVGALILLAGGRNLGLGMIAAAIAICGVAYGGCQMFPLAMMPDAVAADRERTGKARAGVFTGMWTAGETLGFALGPALVLTVLAVTGFVSSQADEQVTQPDSAVTGVLMAFTAVPAVLILISLPFIGKYGAETAKADALSTDGGTPA